MTGEAVVRGTVTDFDEARGHGEVEAADGRRFFFHCTAVADGSRTITVGAEVTFAVVAGHRGRWEARWLVERRPQSGKGPVPGPGSGPGPAEAEGPGSGPGPAAGSRGSGSGPASGPGPAAGSPS